MEGIQEDTIFIMEQYNFNAPINVQIIYEDDEEISERIITHSKNAQVEIKKRGNTPYTTVESNFGAQAQMQTFNQNNNNVDNNTLNLLIDNMSAIISAQFKFKQIHKTLNTAEIERFKNKYIEMKYCSFKRLMAAVKFLLIPQKHNEIFNRNIIDKIFQNAKVNREMYSMVRSLYYDLIEWTEGKIATEKKDDEAQKKLALITQSKNTANTLNSCHRKRKYPSNDIQQTNASREMLRKHHCQIKTQSTEQNRCHTFNNPPSGLIYYQSNLTTYYNAPENYLSAINTSNSTISVQEQQNNLSTHTFVANSTIDYRETMQRRISQERNGADRQDISRSSVSRDSGFMSPELVFSPQESTNTNYQDPQTTLIPNITSNGTVGFCQVCGRQTEFLCLGCFQIFYCSNLCQKKHWPWHRLRCGNITSDFSKSFASNFA